MSTKALLVTGVTGFIGSYLAEELANREDIDATFIVRPHSLAAAEGAPLVGSTAKVVVSTLTDPVGTQLPGRRYDAVINLVGPRSVDVDGQWLANVEYVARLSALLKRIDIGHIVHLSSVAVYGTLADVSMITETSEPFPDTWYGKTKLLGEAIWGRFHRETHVPVSVLRPTWVVGDGSHLLDRYLLLASIRRMKIHINVETPTNVIYVRDVARAILRTAEVSVDGFSSYNLNLPERVPVRRFLEVIDRLGKQPGIRISIPRVALELAARRVGFLDVLLRNVYYSPEKAKEALGFVPQYDLAQMVRDSLQHMGAETRGSSGRALHGEPQAGWR